jgi:hypothetical protein
VTKVSEEERSSEEEVIRRMMMTIIILLTISILFHIDSLPNSSRHPPYFIPLSLLPLHQLFTILPPSSLSFSLYSFLPALFLIPVGCAFQHLANLSFSNEYILNFPSGKPSMC